MPTLLEPMAKPPKPRPTKPTSKQPPQLSARDRVRLFEDISKHGHSLGPQIAGWIHDGVRVTRMVASGNTDLIPVFWIRIYGVLADISDQLDKTLASMKDIGLMDRPNRDATAGLRVRNAIDNLAATYESDELVYLQYRRHVECHPLQSAYRLRPTAKGLDDKVHHRLLDKALSVEDTEEALRRIIMKHRMEHLIALNFAQRAVDPMDEIEAASPAWFGPPR